jgi:hypothetical protein
MIRSAVLPSEAESLKDLRRIPGVGPSIARDLYELGVRRVADLKKADPEDLYERRCVQQGVRIDRCLLYVFRCAVYFASHKAHDPELLKWWNWKDRPADAG